MCSHEQVANGGPGGVAPQGLEAGAAAAATVALGATIGPVLAVVAAVPTAMLGWRWWKHRAKNGIKF